MEELVLTKVIMGLSNTNHDHVHRHTTINIGSEDIDRLKYEEQVGMVTLGTISEVAKRASTVSSRPTGMVGIEDGFNVRRGLAMFKFNLASNAMTEQECVMLGYLVGGDYSAEGIMPNTMFMPVRSWMTASRHVANGSMVPHVSRTIDDSNLFLSPDPTERLNLYSIRPRDVIETVYAENALQIDNEFSGTTHNVSTMGGVATQSLNNTVNSSKTQNLSPVNYGTQIIRASVSTIRDEDISLALGDFIHSPEVGESRIADNPMFLVMSKMLGALSANQQFRGWSIGEIASVFHNLPDVLNVDMLDTTLIGNVDNILTSKPHGAAINEEIWCKELTSIAAHALIKVGLTTLDWSATNDPATTGGMGSIDGIEFTFGTFASVFDHDEHALDRVQRFREIIASHFFAKFNTGYMHSTTIISVRCTGHMFGETRTELWVGETEGNTESYVNVEATFAVNRTSTNVAPLESALNEATNVLSNIKEYFRG